MMKRIYRITLLLLAMLLPTTAVAYDFEVDGIYYNINGNEATVTYKSYSNYIFYNDCSGEVTIPATVSHNGITYFVTSIGDCAFYGCRELTSISIPYSVTSIGNSAFWGCSELTSINMPKHITSIGEDAFEYCTELTSIELPNSVTSIGRYAFAYCNELTSITCFATTPPTINSNTFPSDITSQATLYVPIISYNSYRTANYWKAFSTIVSIPTNDSFEVDSIFYQALTDSTAMVIPKPEGIYSFSEVIIPETVTYNGTSYTVTSIGEYAFMGCDELKSVIMGNSITSIGDWAFSNCFVLTDVNIPNSVVSIGEYAFIMCFGLSSINIPNSVTSIGKYAFGHCRGLTRIIVDDGNPVYDSRNNCNAIIETISNTLIYGCRNTIIPNSVNIIEEQAFLKCNGLTNITIPNSVILIGNSAFRECI